MDRAKDGDAADRVRASKEARVDLLSLVPEEAKERLEAHFRARGMPSFRAGQVLRWLYQPPFPPIEEMTDLPRSEREALATAFLVTDPAPAEVSRSRDGTAKHLWRLADGELVESVLIPSKDRLTLCLSSQAGCAMGCTFCATGWGGLSRQLSAGEIVAQYRASLRWALANGLGPVTNIVYMGMGEPLANRKALHASLSILNRGFQVGARRITVSTVGLVPGIEELAQRPEQFGLALSLHAPTTDLRVTLVPLEAKYPIPELMEAVRAFHEGKGRRVTFEYTMIRGVNDAEELAPELAKLAKKVHAFVNLIPFNPIPYKEWKASEPSRIERFREILEKAGVAAAVREPRGRDIDAACGQLRANALAKVGEATRSPVRSGPTGSDE